MNTKKFTHIGVLVSASACVRDDYRRRVKLRETQNFWVTESGSKYRKNGWPPGAWPHDRLELESIKPIEPKA